MGWLVLLIVSKKGEIQALQILGRGKRHLLVDDMLVMLTFQLSSTSELTEEVKSQPDEQRMHKA